MVIVLCLRCLVSSKIPRSKHRHSCNYISQYMILCILLEEYTKIDVQGVECYMLVKFLEFSHVAKLNSFVRTVR